MGYLGSALHSSTCTRTRGPQNKVHGVSGLHAGIDHGTSVRQLLPFEDQPLVFKRVAVASLYHSLQLLH
jgi:hypothetical protein